MAKTSGIPSSFTIDDDAGTPVTFSNQIAQINLDISQAQQDSSGLDVTGTERIALRGDWSASVTGAAMDESVVIPVFGDIRTARDLVITYPGTTTFTAVGIITNFTPSVSQDGAFGWSATIVSSDGTFPTLS